MSNTLDNKILGKPVADSIMQTTAARVANIKAKTGKTVCLATVLVGEDPASHTYIRMKHNRCEQAGIASRHIKLDDSTTTEQLVATITELGADPDVHGILLQHPVPKQIDAPAARHGCCGAVDGRRRDTEGACGRAGGAGAPCAASICQLVRPVARSTKYWRPAWSHAGSQTVPLRSTTWRAPGCGGAG